ncbi:tetratricopeptide repeat protein, partial [Waterburya agarophytonicola K14]
MVHKQKKISPLSLIIGISSLSFLLIPIFYNSVIPTISVAEKVVERELEEKDLEQIATSISVKITSETNGGSGVLIAREDNVYTVLTNNHVVENQQKITIQTSDGKNHQAKKVNVDSDEKDVALLQFSSDIDYQIAALKNSKNIAKGDRVFISGFPFRDKTSESRELIFRNGRVSFILQKALKAGYKIGYVTEENAVEKGMSGGAILDRSGKLIGINGIHANPLWGNPYIYENGDTPNEELRAKMSLSNWGVPVEILTQYAPNIAIEIPTEQLSASAESEKKTTVKTPDLVSSIDAKAKEISVLISWSTPTGLSNGSGVLIAQEGNTYHVLTAEHVVSNANESLKIVTHDGREYQIKSQKTFEGADLALLEFTSNESYQVATIGDYYRGLEDRVIFVSGWSSSKQTVAENIESNREFNAGYLLGYHSVNQARDNRSFNNGWELVYSNFTSIGMSGSPLLDIEGNLIGIHAGSESDQGRISPVPQENDPEPIHDIGYSLGVPVKTFLAKLEQSQTDLGLNPQNSTPQKLSDVKQDNVIRSLVDLTPPTADADEVAWLNYGNKLWRLRDYDKSLQAYEKAIEIKPDFHKAWYAHGWALMRQKNYTQAKVSFNEAIEYIDESNYEAATIAWRQLGDAHFYLGEYEESIKAFKKAIRYRPDDFIVYQWLSESSRQSGRYQEAIKALKESLSLNPNSSTGYSRLASILSDNGEFEAAIAQISKAIELEPGNADHYSRRGQFYSYLENYEAAIADFNKAVEIEPSHAEAHVSRGLVRANQGNESGFNSDADRALSLQPENAFIYTTRGNGYFALGKIEQGFKDYNTAINLDSNFAHFFYVWRGQALNFQGEYEKAIADYNRAIELQPKIGVYYRDRGRTYLDQKNYQLALADFNKAIEIEADDYWTHAWRGFTHAKMGNKELFISDFDKAISLDPESSWLHTMRGDGYFALNEVDKGIQEYDTAISLEPTSAHQYYNRLGNQFHGLENYERAIANYNKAIELKPNNALYYVYRGNSYAQAGNTQKLIEDYNKAISLNPDLAHKYHNQLGDQ